MSRRDVLQVGEATEVVQLVDRSPWPRTVVSRLVTARGQIARDSGLSPGDGRAITLDVSSM
jgi:hypothetical protein